jgi:hypothetical protein
MSGSAIVRRVLNLLLSSPLIAVVESEGMANPEYVWWIAERPPPAASGGVQAHRLTQYGSFPDKESAERTISELKKFPQCTKADLVASKQSNAGQVQ